MVRSVTEMPYSLKLMYFLIFPYCYYETIDKSQLEEAKASPSTLYPSHRRVMAEAQGKNLEIENKVKAMLFTDWIFMTCSDGFLI